MLPFFFFGVGGFFIARKIFENKAGLIIDQCGITDNSAAASVGLIEWEDIQEIKTLEIMSTKILLINTVNPEKYIGKAQNAVSRRIMKANQDMYGSPIQISPNALKISYSELHELIITELNKRKK